MNLTTGRGTGGDAEGDTLEGIENLFGSIRGDSLTGDGNNNRFNGFNGNDTLDGGAGDDILNGDSDNDSLIGGTGADTLTGGAGDDILNGDSDNDSLIGGTGADTLTGGAGDDLLIGGAGNDSLTGGGNNDFFQFAASHGSDTITDFVDGTDGIRLSGVTDFASQVTVRDSDADATVTWSGGTITVQQVDHMLLTEGDFGFLVGDENANTITGTAVSDVISGLGGNDELNGLGGNDTLTGGAGNDTLDGGGGADEFVFASGHGSDTIENFVEEDNINITDGSLTFDDIDVQNAGNDATATWVGGTITFKDVDHTTITTDDFTFG